MFTCGSGPQNALRSQAAGARSFDLVTAVAQYFVTLEAHGDAQGMPEMLQAMETLTDMLQGPCTENIDAVIQARVVDTCKRILAWTERDLRVRLLNNLPRVHSVQ